MTPEQLDALRGHRDEERTRADGLIREGRYGEACKVIDELTAELREKLKDVAQQDQQRAYVANSFDVLKGELDEFTRWARLAQQANTSARAAMDLVLELLHPTHMAHDGRRATVRDPHVRALVALLRQLDPNAAKLLGPRQVNVVVKGKHLDDAALGHFSAELVATLRALGLDAALGSGTELFEVELVMQGPVSAHLIGDDVDECALIAVAKWPAGGLDRLDLTSHGFGDEETQGNCFRCRVRQSIDLVAEQLLRTARGLTLAVNYSKAEGPNGVF